MTSLEGQLALAVDAAHREGSVGLVVGPGSDCGLLQSIVKRTTGEDIKVREEGQSPPDPGTRATAELVMLRAEVRSTGFSSIVDVSSDIDVASELFAIAGQILDGNSMSVSALSGEFAPALGVLRDLGSRVRNEVTGYRDCVELSADARRTRTFYRSVREAFVFGNTLFDLARAMLLIDPEPMELSDEWAEMASVVSGSAISVSMISRVLTMASEYFVNDGSGNRQLVTFRTPFSKTALTGMVPLSQSEHVALYQRLRTRGLESLHYRGDSSDAFVRRQLPVQAVRGGALGQLLSDPTAVLSSDVLALAEQVERCPGVVRSLHGRIFLLAAHHLLGDSDRTGHLELSALRSGDSAYSDDISRLLENSAWRGVWNKSEPVNTSRVVVVCRSPALHVCAVRGDALGRFIVTCSDGTIWMGHAYSEASVAYDGSDTIGELRSCDAVATPDGWFAAAVSSDQKVVCFDGQRRVLSWIDDKSHKSPLSCVAIGGEYPNHIIASSGVDGQIRFWKAQDGTPYATTYQRSNRVGLPVEIRGVQFFSDGLLAFCAGDGFVGILDYSTGELVAERDLGVGILNALHTRFVGGTIRFIVGASSGLVVRTSWNNQSRMWGPITVVSQHMGGVNDVDCIFVGGVEQVVSASSDRTWRMARVDLSDEEIASEGPPPDPVTGHFGSVLSIAKVPTNNGELILTGGSEGLCRIWVPGAVEDEALRVEKGSRHVGPVNAIRLRPVGDRDATIYTGGADGRVRRWHVGGTSTSRPLVLAPSSITVLAISQSEHGAREEVVAATDNGAILYFEVKGGDTPQPVTLGISPDSITALCMLNANDQQFLISGADDGSTALWNLDRIGHRTPITQSPALHNGTVTSICAAKGAEAKPIVIVATQDGYLSFRALPTLGQFSERRMSAGVNHVSELPAYEHGWVAGLIDGCISFRSSTTPTTSFMAHQGDVTRVGATVLGGRTILVSTGLDRFVRVWDLPTHECLQEIELDGIPLDLHVTSNFVAVATTSGATVFRLMNELFSFGLRSDIRLNRE